MMVEDHTKDIGKYEKQASSGDADTAALAQKTLPDSSKAPRRRELALNAKKRGVSKCPVS